MRCKVLVELSRETLAIIRMVIEEELHDLEVNGECEKHLLHCVALMDALEELPVIK
jgi:hypothetical protein